jgi:diguanylate cyclase (GGDEF)-like protein
MGSVKQIDLKHKLYIISLYTMMIFSVVAILSNLLVGLPLSINIKWLFIFAIALVSFLYNKYRGFSDLMKFLFFLFVNGIVIPICFVDAGGSQSFTIAYIFIDLIVVTFILDGHYRNIIIATIILVFMGMHTYDYLFPEKIPVYDAGSVFFDRLIQVPILLFLCFLLVRRFADAYYHANEILIQYAHFDELTGLLNRRNFNDILQKKFDSGDDNGYLIMMDIDNFKLINDKKGHLAGDDGLKHLGGILIQYFDDGKNMISRWGGDEFIIIFFGDADQIDTILEKVKSDFKKYIDPIEPLVDISFGFAPLEGCKTPNDVLGKSDKIMYEKKRGKKNGMVMGKRSKKEYLPI